MMNGNVRMMGGIVKVGGERILLTEPFLSHFYFVSREDYEMHAALSFRSGHPQDYATTRGQPTGPFSANSTRDATKSPLPSESTRLECWKNPWLRNPGDNRKRPPSNGACRPHVSVDLEQVRLWLRNPV